MRKVTEALKEEAVAAVKEKFQKLNRMWKEEVGTEFLNEIFSDKAYVLAIPREDKPTEAIIADREGFYQGYTEWAQSAQRTTFEHRVESIKVVGPIAYEVGTTTYVTGDGKKGDVRFMNVFAKDETGWKLIFSGPFDP